jgi:hypothetical protein
MWSQYIYDVEIMPKIKEIFEMYKGGYSAIQQLISFINIVLFYLKHEEGATIHEKLPELLAIADCFI